MRLCTAAHLPNTPLGIQSFQLILVTHSQAPAQFPVPGRGPTKVPSVSLETCPPTPHPGFPGSSARSAPLGFRNGKMGLLFGGEVGTFFSFINPPGSRITGLEAPRTKTGEQKKSFIVHGNHPSAHRQMVRNVFSFNITPASRRPTDPTCRPWAVRYLRAAGKTPPSPPASRRGKQPEQAAR